jgi:hypothetical protein
VTYCGVSVGRVQLKLPAAAALTRYGGNPDGTYEYVIEVE